MAAEPILRIWFEHVDAKNKPARSMELAKIAYDEVNPTLAQMDPVDNETRGTAFKLTDKSCRALIPLFERIRDGKSAATLSSGSISLASEVEPDKAEWYAVRPANWIDEVESSGGQITIRVDRIKLRGHLCQYSEALFVSQRFVDFVRGKQMTGIDFIWVKDKGKYAAMQWYVPLGTSFAGRGADHPWFDPATRGQYVHGGFKHVQPTDPASIIGVREFSVHQLKKKLAGASKDLQAVMKLLAEIKTGDTLAISARWRLVRDQLPATHWAYLRTAEPTGLEQKPYRTVRLCCTAETRKQLIDAKLASAEDFDPMDIVETPSFSASGALTGLYDSKQLAKVRAMEAKALADHKAKPKPERPVKAPELAKLLPKLKKVLKKQKAEIRAGASEQALRAVEASAGVAIPPRWRELLQLIDGFILDNSAALDGMAELRIAQTSDLVEENRNLQALASGYGEIKPAPKHLLGVGSSDIGDGIFLDTSKVNADGDCPVLHMDHETVETVMTWPAIGLFLEDAIEVSDEE